MKKKARKQVKAPVPAAVKPALQMDAPTAMRIIRERVELIEKNFSDIPSTMEYRDALLLALEAMEELYH